MNTSSITISLAETFFLMIRIDTIFEQHFNLLMFNLNTLLWHSFVIPKLQNMM